METIIQMPKSIQIGSHHLNSSNFTIIAGPCSIESHEQFLKTAEWIKKLGVPLLRGGIFKLRTHPQSFQGLGSKAFEIVKTVKKETNLSFVSEISDPRQISDLIELVDLFQVGSRNMHNYALLKELSQINKPILLKRGFCATIEEWLLAAEYLSSGNNKNIILCERGIRTFETKTRNTLDLSAVAYIKAHTDYPVIVDPSHGTGLKELVIPMALASVAAGADGLLIEVHPEPDKALSDGFQTLNFNEFENLLIRLKPLLNLYGRG